MARILIVDDDEAHRLALITMLERAGHEAFEADDGDKALWLYGGRVIDVVITDLQMPKVHGLELITVLRDLSPPPKIIAISGTGADQLSMAKALGAKVTLNKPVFPDALLSAVAEALGDEGAPQLTMLVVSDPPHTEVDLDAAATIIGLDVYEARLKFIFAAPEVLATSDEEQALGIAKSYRGAGVRVAIIDGQELAAIPWPNPVSSFDFTSTGLSVRMQDQDVELPYDSGVVGVYCRPPSDFSMKPPEKRDEADSDGFSVVEAIEWMANLDLYFVRDGALQRISIVEDLMESSGHGARRRRTVAENMEATVAECIRRFTRIHVDTRLNNVRPRRRFVPGDSAANPDSRKRYSFGTLLLRDILASISPDLRDLTQYELGSRLGYVTSRDHASA